MNKKMNRLLAIIVSLTMLLPAVSIAASASTSAKGVEDLVYSNALKESGSESGNKSGNYPLTYHDMDYKVPRAEKTKFSQNKVSTLPSSYDMRNVSGALPAVRDQNPYGTCWAFSAISAAETSMIVDGLADNSVDLSELNLAYNTFRQVNDPLGNFTGDYTTTSGDTMLDVGGNSILATLTLARWGGVTNESVMPYDNAVFACGYNYPDEYSSGMDVAHLENAEWLNITTDSAEIKEYVTNGYAVSIAYFEDNVSYNSSTYAYYQNTALNTNHAVAIVGWDDNFSKTNFKAGKQPSSDGAWLIRNSWGAGSNDNGYFWLSYEDSSLTDGMACVFDFAVSDNYDRNYQYDGASGFSSVSISDVNSLTGANVYTAKGGETLKAVGICNVDNRDVDYNVSVYLNPTNKANPSSGVLASTASGHIKYCGYHTIELDTPINLNAGDKFAIVVTQTDVSGDDLWIAYDDSYDYGWMKSFSTYSTGQSFISFNNGGNWTDFATACEGNLRIKAFTEVNGLDAPENIEAVVAQNDVTVSWNSVSGAERYEVYAKGENQQDYSLITTTSQLNYTYTPNSADGLVFIYKIKAVSASLSSDYSVATTAKLPVTRSVRAFDFSCNNEYMDITLQKGESAQTVLDFLPSNATDKLVVYSSDNSSIASVTPDGVVTANGYGNTIITAISRDGNISRTLTFHVPQIINVTSLAQMQSTHNYAKNTEQLYIYQKANATSISVKFSSNTYTTGYLDCIKIYNGSDVLQGTYSGNQLANKTVTVQGDTFKLLLQTDNYSGAYGFCATAITYTGGELNTATINSYINEAKALVRSDYTPQSWEVLQSALTNAETALGSPASTQNSIDTAAASLRSAIDSLEDYIKLQSLSITADGAENGMLKIFVPEGTSLATANAQLLLNFEPVGAMYKSVSWETSDFFVKVDENGRITAYDDFAAFSTITATVTDDFGNTKSADIVVAILHYDTNAVTLSQKNLFLALNDDPYELNASVTDNDGHASSIYDLTWESSDENVVTVYNGVVTVVGEGTATVTATADFGGASDSCTVTVGKHNHNYNAVVTAPTCTEDGYTTYTCECGDSYVADSVAALGHTWGEWKVTTPATTTAEGVETRTCSVCGETETRAIAKLTLNLGNLRILTSRAVVEGNTIKITSYNNAKSMVIYSTTKDGKTVNVDRTGTPITKGSTGFIITHINWEKAGSKDIETTITIDGNTFNLVWTFVDTDFSEDYLKTLKTYSSELDTESKKITITSAMDADFIDLYQYSDVDHSFELFPTIDGKTVTNVTSTRYRIFKTATSLEIPVVVNEGRYCEDSYTLVINFVSSPFNPAKYIRPIYGAIELANDGEDYILVTMTPGKAFTGIIAEGISGATLELDTENVTGTLDSYKKNGVVTQYRAVAAKNTVDDEKIPVETTITIKLADGSEVTYRIKFAFEAAGFSGTVLSTTNVQTVTYDAANTKLVLNGSGDTYIAIRKTTLNGLGVEIANIENYTNIVDMGNIYMIYKPASGVFKCTLNISDGTTVDTALIYLTHASYDSETGVIGTDYIYAEKLSVTRGYVEFVDGQLQFRIVAGKSKMEINELVAGSNEIMTIEPVSGVTYANNAYTIASTLIGQHINVTISGVTYDVLVTR